MPTAKKANPDILVYNGRNAARAGNKVYLGNSDDMYYVEMTVNKSEMIGDLEISTDVSVNLIQNDKENGAKVIKSGKKEGLFSSFETASKWLSDEESKK